jgi:hypothetical protein
MRYLLGTSFFSNTPFKRDMERLWIKNIDRSDIWPDRCVAIFEGGFLGIKHGGLETIELKGDLGHIGSHLNNSKPHHLTGWSASVCALAMLAYVNESDFIYRESDCLAFGPWVSRMYKDCEGAEFVFGPKMTSAPWMSCAQSLFLIKHHFLPAFVSVFLSLPPDRQMLGEDKFVYVENCYPHLTKRLTFGVDRQRPIPWDDEVFYAQQFTSEELAECRKRNLL